MINLGVLYEDGRGVAKDLAQAVAWYRQAAEKGDASAMCFLGDMYLNGRGAARDMAQALAWYRKAAALGNESAKANLKKLGQ
jgi:TPR repeat protein